ncbi:MAG: aldo/keto reductase, partial [Nitrososphaerota archaeon]
HLYIFSQTLVMRWDKQYTDRDLIEAFKKAVEHGVNFFDTAEIYGDGRSEEILGRCLSMVEREEIVVATKFSPMRITEKSIVKALESSLKRLKTNYIDLYQVHWPNPLLPILKAMKILEKMWENGKIRTIGVCNFNLRQLEEARNVLSRTDVVSNQIEYNMLKRDPEKKMIDYCIREKITIIAYSPLAQGALTGKYTSKNKPRDPIRILNPYFTSKRLEKLQLLVEKLREIGEKHGKSVVQVVLSWVTRWPNVVAIPGVKRVEHVLDIVGAAGLKLSDDELKIIEAELEKLSSGRLTWIVNLLKNYLAIKLSEKKLEE